MPSVDEGSVTAGRKPTVALVAHGIHDQGGMERAFAELIRRAHERYDFVVFAVKLDEELRNLVRWRRIRMPMRPVTLLTPLFSLLAGLDLARARTRERVDIVHVQGAIVPNRVHLATIHFCHAGQRALTGRYAPAGAPRLRRFNTSLARRFAVVAERWCYRPARTGAAAAVSPGIAAEMQRHFPGLPIVLTPNGVDADRFRSDPDARRTIREQYGTGSDEVVALFVGGDWDRKGLAESIEGLAVAQRSTVKKLRLWVVGGGDERRFDHLAARVGIADRITFMGPQPATARFYQGADLFVIPTLYETFSLAAHEAASAGLPIVSTRVSGIEDLLAGGEAGLLVERTAEEVGAAIAQLAADDELRKRMGAAAARRASTFTWERSVDAVLAVYDGILRAPNVVQMPLREARAG